MLFGREGLSTMDVMDAIKKRRSVRKYKPDEIPEDVLDKLLNAMRLAPSGKNRQPWKFIVVRDEVTKAKLAEACNGQVACGSEKEAAIRYYRDGRAVIGVGWDIEEEMENGSIEYESCVPIDLAIALDHLTLAAVEEGLGTCWIGALNEEQVKELLSVPDDMRASLVMPIGYPVSWPESRSRRSLEEVVCYETYS
jgi:nitroreductase